MRPKAPALFPLVAACLALAALPALASEPVVIRWLVAHDRGNSPFTRLNEDFARQLEKKSGGRLKIAFAKSDAPESRLDETAFRRVADGGADMSQLAASGAGVHVFDMPFLFRGYDHAEAAFAAPVGQRLLDSIAAGSGGKVRGFGFTYSGGQRVLAGRLAVRRLADLKGARMRRGTSHLAAFMKGLGAELVEAGPASREAPVADVASGRLDLEETEINRLALVEAENPGLAEKLPFVNLTHHRMYVTALVANAAFLAKLPPDLRALLTDEAQALAASERKLSIDLEKKNLGALRRRAGRIVEFSAAERPAFAAAGEAFLKNIPEMGALVREIQALKEPVRVTLR
jgi:TRAP-type transport system periplasmic protein